jgi:hypothetical protein
MPATSSFENPIASPTVFCHFLKSEALLPRVSLIVPINASNLIASSEAEANTAPRPIAASVAARPAMALFIPILNFSRSLRASAISLRIEEKSAPARIIKFLTTLKILTP